MEGSSMEIVPLGPGFAAELRGVTLAEVAADDAAYGETTSISEQNHSNKISSASASALRPTALHRGKVQKSARPRRKSPCGRAHRPWPPPHRCGRGLRRRRAAVPARRTACQAEPARARLRLRKRTPPWRCRCPKSTLHAASNRTSDLDLENSAA
jgi:hypothetical protein